MSQMTLTQEEMREAVAFYLNQRILKIAHEVTKVEVVKSDSHQHLPKSFRIEMVKVEQQPQREKVTPKTPAKELGRKEGQGPLDAAIKQ